MFAGWFKIEGHSNPNHRKFLQKSLENQQKERRLKGNNSNGNKGRKKDLTVVFKSREKQRKIYHILLLILASFFGITMIFLIGIGRSHNSGTAKKMMSLQLEATGSSEFISFEEKILRNVNQMENNGNYIEVYHQLKDLFERGITDQRLILKIHQTSQIACEKRGGNYCEEMMEWQEILARLKLKEPDLSNR